MCVKCTELVLLFLALGLLAAVVFVSISIFFTLKVNGLLWQEVVQTSDQIKVFMVYMQRLAIIVRVHVQSIRRYEFFVIQQATQSFTNPLLVSLDCLFTTRPSMGFGIARHMLTIIIPIIVLALSLPIALTIRYFVANLRIRRWGMVNPGQLP